MNEPSITLVPQRERPPLGVQSYCFHKVRDLGTLWRMCAACGIDRLEYWPHHLLFHEDGIREKVALALRHSIKPSAYGLVVLHNDVREMRTLFGFCRDLGVHAMTATVAPEHYALAEDLSGEFGIRVAVHNHGAGCPYGTFDRLDALLQATGPDIGLCLDTAWIMQAGHDALEALDRYRERIYGVHLKDFRFHDDTYTDVVVGQGALDLPEAMGRIRLLPNLLYLSLEYEGSPANPVPALVKSVNALRSLYPKPRPASEKL